MTQKESGAVKPQDDFLTVGKAARLLGTSRWSLYRWIEAEKVVAVQIGGVLFVPKSEIERLNNEEESK